MLLTISSLLLSVLLLVTGLLTVLSRLNVLRGSWLSVLLRRWLLNVLLRSWLHVLLRSWLSILLNLLSVSSLLSVLGLLTVASLVGGRLLLRVAGVVCRVCGLNVSGFATTVVLAPLDVEPLLAKGWDEVSQLSILIILSGDTLNNAKSLGVKIRNVLLVSTLCVSESFGDSG